MNLSDDAYHADPALGSTDLKAILTNPVAWHWKNRNPLREQIENEGLTQEQQERKRKETDAKRFGKALHKIVLEGPDAFDAAYYLAPAAPEGLLEKKEELAAWISERAAPMAVGQRPWFTGFPQPLIDAVTTKKGAPKATARNEHLVAAARLMGCELLAADWAAKVAEAADGREVISAEWWRQLQMIRRVLEGHSVAPKYLQNGRAEVSVFWTDEDGCRFKARFDYLRVRVVSDLKSYAVREGLEPIQAFCYAVEAYGYDVSRAHYMDARLNVLPELVEAGKIFEASGYYATPEGERTWDQLLPRAEDVDFLQRVAAEAQPVWAWIAASTLGFPEIDAIELPEQTLVAMAAQTQLREAVASYKENRAKFGEDDTVPWVADRGVVVVDDAMFGRKSANRGQKLWTRGD